MKCWYVVSTHVHGERRALFHLTRQGYTAYLPQYFKRRRHARRIDWAPTPLFPRYLFVELDTEHQQWRAIRSTVGVHHMVCTGDRPTRVPVGIVDGIRAREDEAGMVVLSRQSPFEPGDRVQVLNGALSDQVGIFDCVDDKARVIVLLDLLGRQVRVRLPMEAVAAYA